MKKIAIIGAGLTGITLARILSQSAEITLFEKSRGVGGRLATRYASPFQFDHGAQFFTAKSAAFNQFIEPLISASIIKRWDARFVEFDHDKIIAKRQWNGENPHYIGYPKMNQIGKFLADSLSIQLQTRIAHIMVKNQQWVLLDDNKNELGKFDWVITTTPVEQAIAIMPTYFK